MAANEETISVEFTVQDMACLALVIGMATPPIMGLGKATRENVANMVRKIVDAIPDEWAGESILAHLE